MAKVKIQGSASGTGILSVVAPDTDVNRTITLPDATGTLLTSAPVTALSATSVSSVPVASGSVIVLFTSVSGATTLSIPVPLAEP